MGGAVRLGLVGAGRWGCNYIRTLAELDGVELAGVVSRRLESLPLSLPDTMLYRHWSELFTDQALDGVIIATPPATHAEIAMTALSRGLAVLIEKPLTLSVLEAERLRDHALGCGRPVMVDHTHLFSPVWRALKGLVRSCGGITAIRGVAGNRGPCRPDTPVLWDWGAHDVAMCLDLLGTKPGAVAARRLSRHQGPEAVAAETIALTLRFPGVTAELTIGTDMDKVRRFEVDCGSVRIVYDDLAVDRLTVDGVRHPVAYERPLKIVTREFVALIRAGSADISGLDLGLQVVDVLERCQAAL